MCTGGFKFLHYIFEEFGIFLPDKLSCHKIILNIQLLNSDSSRAQRTPPPPPIQQMNVKTLSHETKNSRGNSTQALKYNIRACVFSKQKANKADKTQNGFYLNTTTHPI